MIHHGNARPLRIVSLLTIAGLLLWACGGVGPTKTAAGGDEPSAAPPPALDPGTADQTTVKVTWTAPDTELIVTAYTVRWRSASDTEWTEVENIQSTDGAYTISDLQPATEYEVQVRAVFETGDGAWSESVTVTTTEAASDPMSDPMTVAPPMVVTETPGRTTVKINWTAPEIDLPETDLVITDFTVRWREPSDTAWMEAAVPSTETTYTISGLQSGTEYEVQVRAVFVSGAGAWSPSATVQTEPGSVTPRPPRRIYWVEASGEAIKRANLDGTGVETLVQTGSGSDPAGIALTASKMYWTDYGTDTIKRANLDGSVVEVLVAGNGSDPGFIALAGGKMYWTERGHDRVRVANLDGSNQSNLFNGPDDPQGIAIAGGRIYWTETANRDTVKSAPLEDVSDVTIIRDNSGTSSPHGVAVDTTNGKVYWVDYDRDTVERADLDGGNYERIITTGLNQPRDIAISR